MGPSPFQPDITNGISSTARSPLLVCNLKNAFIDGGGAHRFDHRRAFKTSISPDGKLNVEPGAATATTSSTNTTGSGVEFGTIKTIGNALNGNLGDFNADLTTFGTPVTA